jgi:photosystem II stability/assembly factor-like uncharacterized protein
VALNRELQQEVHMRQTGWVLAFLAVVGLAVLAPAAQGGTPTPGNVPVVATVDGAVRSFGASSPHAWVVAAMGALLLTADGGASWREATPPDVTLTGAAVAFLDPATGWVAELAPDAPGAVRVAATTDGGRTWQIHQHTLFARQRPGRTGRALAMHWLDRDTGWLVVRQATSSNFNQGTLFGTQDGGASWQRLTLPGGEPVYFISATTGWTAGGPHGDTWFRSDDGGRTWQPVAALSRRRRARAAAPLPAALHRRWAARRRRGDDGNRDRATCGLVRHHDGGASWAVVDELPGPRLNRLLYSSMRRRG